ncbi:hypothetical protein AVXHC19_42070 [Acidovorax sacchari]
MNLYESKYGDIKIAPSLNAKSDPAFYRNADKGTYAGKLKIYAPKQRLGLEEYYIPGNDSFTRVMASPYITCKSTEVSPIQPLLEGRAIPRHAPGGVPLRAACIPARNARNCRAWRLSW